MALDVPMRFAETPLLWCVDGILAPGECANLIADIEAGAPTLATHNPIYRDQDRIIRDDPELAGRLFQRLGSRLPPEIGPLRLIGLNERIRMYRYSPGQRFSPHMDHWYIPDRRRITLLTVLVYLNDGFEGGQTRFMEQLEQTVAPRAGLAAVFQHKIRHEGCPVLRGTKYALRTDVLYQAPEDLGLVGGTPAHILAAARDRAARDESR